MTSREYLASIRARNPYERLVYYMSERLRIHQHRTKGLPRERWTPDPILRTYKFTNVHRAWDYTSQWLTQNWYDPYGKTHRLAGLACCAARLICYVPSLEAIGFPRHDPYGWLRDSERTLNHRAKRGYKVFTSAYIIGGVPEGRSKVPWVLRRYVRGVWTHGVLSRRWTNAVDLHMALREHQGFGDFLAQEVVLDLMQTWVASGCSDKQEYGFAGPGARRGLNRVRERDAHHHISSEDARHELIDLWSHLATKDSGLPPELWETLTVHDVEFNLCEFDKYERALLGEGRPRQKYVPRTEDTGDLFA